MSKYFVFNLLILFQLYFLESLVYVHVIKL
jgi:hypothetical protein